MNVRGGGVYDSEVDAINAAIRNYYNSPESLKAGSVPPRLDVDFGVYRANSNPRVWVWEFPPRG
jgi:hypothetical protein